MRPLFSCVALVIGKKSLSFHILLCTLHTMYCRAGGASNAIANLSITPSALGCSRGAAHGPYNAQEEEAKALLHLSSFSHFAPFFLLQHCIYVCCVCACVRYIGCCQNALVALPCLPSGYSFTQTATQNSRPLSLLSVIDGKMHNAHAALILFCG